MSESTLYMGRFFFIILLLLTGQSADAQPFLNAAEQIDSEAHKVHIMQRDQERVALRQRIQSFHRTNNRTAHKPSSTAQRLKYWIRPSTDEYNLPQTDSIVFAYSSNYGSEFDYDRINYNLLAHPHIIGSTNQIAHHSYYDPVVKFDTAYCFTNGLLGSRQDTFYVKYSPEGNPVEQKLYNQLFIRTYNNRSLITSEVVYDLDTEDSTAKYEFEYNQDGQLVLWSCYSSAQYGFLEIYMKEVYRYTDPNADLPAVGIRYFRNMNTINDWFVGDSIVINSARGNKSYTITAYNYPLTGSWEFWFREIHTYDGDQLLSIVSLDDFSGADPVNPKDTTYHMARTLNNDHLPVQSYVRSFYPQFQIWDTSVHTVTYNANNNPVRVQRNYLPGGISEHRYGYETYRRSSVSPVAAEAVLSGVYPNPAGSVLYVLTDGVAAGGADVRLINTLGQQAHAASVFVPENSGRATLSLEGVPPGHYRLCLTDAMGKQFYAGFIKL